MAYKDQSIIPEDDAVDVLGHQTKRFSSIACVTLYCENITVTGSTFGTSPDSETKTGIVIDSSTNKVKIPNNFEDAITFEGTITFNNVTKSIQCDGPVDINSTVDISNTLTVAGKATFNNATESIECNGPVDINSTVNISETLIVGGLFTLNANLKCPNYFNQSGSDLQGMTWNVNDEAIFYGTIRAEDPVTGIIATNDIQTNSVFVVGGNSGITTTVDFSTYAGVLSFVGGILCVKS